MKYFFLFLLLPCLFLYSCRNDNSKFSSAAYDSLIAARDSHTAGLKKFKAAYDACTDAIDPTQVGQYKDAYKKWAAQDPKNVLDHLTLDMTVLSGYMDPDLHNLALRFEPVIMNGDTTILLEEVKAGGKIKYTNIKCMFWDQTGRSAVLNETVFCPPPYCTMPTISDAKAIK